MMLGTTRAWVVHGADGIDELTTTGYTKISECRGGAVNTFYLHPSGRRAAESQAGRCRAATRAKTRGITSLSWTACAGRARDVRAGSTRARRCSSQVRRRRSTKAF